MIIMIKNYDIKNDYLKFNKIKLYKYHFSYNDFFY